MDVHTEPMSISADTSGNLIIDCLEKKVLYYKQQCSKLLSIILNELKEVSKSNECSHHFETLTKTISEHLTNKYEIEFAYLKERDEAMKTMEKKVEDLELELKETREASKISEDGINLLMKIRKEDAETQIDKPTTQDSSTSTQLDGNQNIITESPKSSLQRYAVEDTVRLENELRKEKESKHKLQSTLSKRIHSLTKQLEAMRAKTPKTVVKDLRSREGTPPRAVQVRDIRTLVVYTTDWSPPDPDIWFGFRTGFKTCSSPDIPVKLTPIK